MTLLDPSVVWSAALLLTAAIVIPYGLGFRRRVVNDRLRKEEAARLGVDRPTAQYPLIDSARCIGCGTCVDACPEGDVLGIVGGIATVVNGLKCIGHAKCQEACPVGAIEVGLGDLRSRPDIPLLDDWGETTVPGLFIAGELGGLALVKNAVSQGARAVARIAEQSRRAGPRGGDVLDVLIVGSGPAGTAAAATAVERRLSHVVLEKEADLGGTIFHYPRRKLVLVQSVDIPLWGRMKGAEYTKERILEIMVGLVARFRIDVRFGERVTDVKKNGGLFSVRTDKGTHLARFVVLALGRRGTPRTLGVPGEELSKVMYQLQDAESYTGQRVLVVGGGDSAVEAALGLARQPGNTVTLSYRREKLVRIKRKNEERILALFREGGVRPLFGSEVVGIHPDRVTLDRGGERLELANDYVFVFAGGEPPFPFLRQIGVRFGGESLTVPKTISA